MQAFADFLDAELFDSPDGTADLAGKKLDLCAMRSPISISIEVLETCIQRIAEFDGSPRR